ncbi:hypothetical protein ACFPVT_03550 [Corynebacterium choanae]|uniref:Uncharacterized protein n=1 Tax=Corynebacterium choanae TaxID=1862358 RepID=A0A3G6JA14_9CORY|nr:hypothetical protein [Corynebacterium choanae]AZA14642.1 hypothetical protein CCHOA_11355 [Corynebacterium choanae]
MSPDQRIADVAILDHHHAQHATSPAATIIIVRAGIVHSREEISRLIGISGGAPMTLLRQAVRMSFAPTPPVTANSVPSLPADHSTETCTVAEFFASPAAVDRFDVGLWTITVEAVLTIPAAEEEHSLLCVGAQGSIGRDEPDLPHLNTRLKTLAHRAFTASVHPLPPPTLQPAAAAPPQPQ